MSRVTLLRVLCRWGNRLTRSYLNVRHLLEPEQATRGNRRQRRSALSTCCFRDNINSFVTTLLSREERGGQHQQPRPQQQQPGARKPRSYEAGEMLTGNFDIDDDTYGVIRVDDVEFGESLMNSAELTRTYFLNASIYTYTLNCFKVSESNNSDVRGFLWSS